MSEEQGKAKQGTEGTKRDTMTWKLQERVARQTGQGYNRQDRKSEEG